nr:uncharacterized protein I303_00715 [Kwoniella dejecticola CBS 10117]OBR88897.1 hypothetical protein I303_00715 [Kwoniella dejecticola CBS 10117]
MLNDIHSNSHVRFASIDIDRQSPPAYHASSPYNEMENSIEVDLSSLLSQAQRQQQQARSNALSSCGPDRDTAPNSRIRRKWEEIPATAFGNILRVRDDPTDDNDLTPTNAKSNILLPDVKLKGDLPRQPKTAPLRLWRELQPLNELYSAPLTPQCGQTSALQPPPTAQQGSLQLPASSSNHTHLAVGTTPGDNTNNVKNHLDGLSMHLEGLFEQVKQLEEMKKEVKYWKDVCLGLEIGKKDLEVVLAQNQIQEIHSKFSAVLIDGDSFVFNQTSLQNGFEGGEEAANSLLRAVDERYASSTVIVQVFVNKSTLGATLIKNGIVQTWAKYDQFWQGFSSSSGLINVCDLGSGEQTAQQKIKDHISLYRDNAQCDRIIIGTSAHNFRDFTDFDGGISSDKVVRLAQHPDDCTETSIIVISDLFQSDELVPLTARPAVQSEVVSWSLDDQVEVYDWATFGTPCDIKQHKKYHDKVKVSSISVSSHTNSSGDDLSPKKKFRKQTKYNKVAAEQVRKLDPRPCHTHYLSEWGCRDVDACSYGHGYRLNNAQLGELSRMAKSVICPYMKEGRCRYDDDDCVYGHKCPNAPKCPFGDGCRFHSLPNGHGELDRM